MAGGNRSFEDIASLANLLLLQEFMLNEEAAHLNASATALSAPGASTVTMRSPNSGETGLGGVTTSIYVKITANTFFGETAAGTTSGAITAANGQVADIQIAPVAGAQWYNVYAATGSSPGTFYLQASKVGGLYYTLQGTLLTVTAAPSSDSGTSSANDQEGLISVLSGHGVSPYPTGWQAGYPVAA